MTPSQELSSSQWPWGLRAKDHIGLLGSLGKGPYLSISLGSSSRSYEMRGSTLVSRHQRWLPCLNPFSSPLGKLW